jgi:outer membrane autotransporter protein
VWAAGTITIGRRDSVDDSGSLGFRSDGVTVGIDRAFGEHMVLGVAGGYGWSDTDTGEESTLDGSQRSLAAYGLWRGSRHLFVDGMLGVGDIDFDIARWSGVAADTAHARRGGHQLFGTLTFGYEHAGEHLTLTSYGRYEASRTTLDAYAESGLGIYDLRYGRQTMDDSGVALGIEGRHRFATPSADWRPYWLVEYRSALQSRSDVGINYVVQPVASDYVLSLRNSFDDALSVGAGLEVDLPRDWQLALQFRHEQAGSNRAESYGLQLSWGKPATMSPTVVEAQLQDPREAGKRAPWQRQP